ncbi:MAG: agmatine deiminase family protein [Candidatus Delongbacteria bacterium]|nr:agmatine deiminase family protein [Candidatus Delongbacteria bacterium]
MNKLRLIPEYEKVSKLYLSFENTFFNTRFGYGKAIAEIVDAVNALVPVEIFVKTDDENVLFKEFQKKRISLENVKIINKYSGTSITTSGFPIFAESTNGSEFFGITYNYLRNHENYDCSFKKIEKFGKWIVEKEGLKEIHLDFDFNSAAIAVMDDVVLVSEDIIDKNREVEIKDILIQLFSQDVYFVPSLPGDFTKDLDTFLMPLKNKTWIVSQYPTDSVQISAIDKTVSILKNLGHRIHFIPGLKSIKYGDINTMPNYVNSIILNSYILVPEYKIEEDRFIKEILENYGYKVVGIDSRKIVESNSVLHCISRTLPYLTKGSIK